MYYMAPDVASPRSVHSLLQQQRATEQEAWWQKHVLKTQVLQQRAVTREAHAQTARAKRELASTLAEVAVQAYRKGQPQVMHRVAPELLQFRTLPPRRRHELDQPQPHSPSGARSKSARQSPRQRKQSTQHVVDTKGASPRSTLADYDRMWSMTYRMAPEAPRERPATPPNQGVAGAISPTNGWDGPYRAPPLLNEEPHPQSYRKELRPGYQSFKAPSTLKGSTTGSRQRQRPPVAWAPLWARLGYSADEVPPADPTERAWQGPALQYLAGLAY